MKKTQAPKSQAPKKAMSLDDMTRELAAGLRDVIQETDSAYLKKDPEEAFVDLACRLVLRLQATLTVVPAGPEERIRLAHLEASARIFTTLGKWMRARPMRSYLTRVSDSGKFQIVVKTPKGTQLFFGDDLQDAYAQAAQTLDFNDS